MSHETPMDEWIARFETGRHPVEQFAARSLREIGRDDFWFSDMLHTRGAVRGEICMPDLFKIVFVAEGEIRSMVLPPKIDPREVENDARIMCDLSNRLQIDTSVFERLEDKAQAALAEGGLITAAAMSWGRSLESRDRRLQIFFPGAFMNLMPVRQDLRPDFALGVAGHFIRRTATNGPTEMLFLK